MKTINKWFLIETEHKTYIFEKENLKDIKEITENDCQKYDIPDTLIGYQGIQYWDGNNHQIEIIADETGYTAEPLHITNEENNDPNPAFSYSKILTLNTGKKINISQSNTSGSLTPWWDFDEQGV